MLFSLSRCAVRLLPFALLPIAAVAQTHVSRSAEPVVRAVAVYEFTGDEAKPTASRVVPVSLFIDNELRDAGVYRADPVPFVLDTGNVFELQHGGVADGTLELAYTRHLLATAGAQGNDEDAWLGYGPVQPKPGESAAPTRLRVGKPGQIVVSGGKGPHLNTAPAASDADDSKPEPVDHSGGASGTVSAQGGDDTTERDRRKNDPERPTLRRRTPQQAKTDQKKSQQASVTGVGSLNDDPDRPVLSRDRPGSPMDKNPPLTGLPAGMHQTVAVSDARDRTGHSFERAFESPQEKSSVLAAMQGFARARLLTYQRFAAPAALPATAPAQTAVASRTGSPRRGDPARQPRPAVPSPAAPLTDEHLAAFTLSYGGAATYVYTAHTAGPAGTTQSVAVVAQQEPGGALTQSFASATDSGHLDRTAELRLVDAVDAEASNRASLLFELRAASTRQFALYRVLSGQTEQTFATGPMPIEK